MAALYRAVWGVSGRDQLLLVMLSLLVAVLAAAPLKFQQLVINSLVYGGDRQRLAWLCAGLLAVVLLSGLLKFVLNFRVAIVGERVVLLIRERLLGNRSAAASEGGAGVATPGSLVTMLAAEAEALGAFAGTAIATPLLQIGTLVSVLGFILVNQPQLGLLAVAVVVPQALVVFALQGRINRRVRERVLTLREASDRVSAGGPEAEIVQRFRSIFATRRRIFLLKRLSKFGLGIISAVGMVAILFAGGLLVLDGRSDVGIVVASLTGLARVEGPWRELVSFYRNASTVRVKYAMVLPSLGLRRPVPPGSSPP